MFNEEHNNETDPVSAEGFKKEPKELVKEAIEQMRESGVDYSAWVKALQALAESKKPEATENTENIEKQKHFTNLEERLSSFSNVTNLKAAKDGNSVIISKAVVIERDEAKNSREDFHPTEEELALIHSTSALVKHERNELYVFKALAANTEVDRDFEHLTLKGLNELAEVLKRKAWLTDHEWKTSYEKGRILDAWVEGENLYVKMFILNSPANKQFLDNIFAGIHSGVSIGFISRAVDMLCDSCNKNKVAGKPPISICDENRCPHEPGAYDEYGMITTVTIDGAFDGFEISSVPVPSQRPAKITKGFNLDNGSSEIIKEVNNLEDNKTEMTLDNSENIQNSEQQNETTNIQKQFSLNDMVCWKGKDESEEPFSQGCIKAFDTTGRLSCEYFNEQSSASDPVALISVFSKSTTESGEVQYSENLGTFKILKTSNLEIWENPGRGLERTIENNMSAENLQDTLNEKAACMDGCDPEKDMHEDGCKNKSAKNPESAGMVSDLAQENVKAAEPADTIKNESSTIEDSTEMTDNTNTETKEITLVPSGSLEVSVELLAKSVESLKSVTESLIGVVAEQKEALVSITKANEEKQALLESTILEQKERIEILVEAAEALQERTKEFSQLTQITKQAKPSRTEWAAKLARNLTTGGQ
jgi:hypothetical protein